MKSHARLGLTASIKLIRPIHWIKNSFIFLPLFFSREITQIDCLLQCLYTFIGFSCIASSIYVINDVIDAPKDRSHPTKRFRPIASGAIAVRQGLTIAASLLLIGLLVLLLGVNQIEVLWVVVGYFVLNLGYSFGLKEYAIVDVFIIAIGFLLRIVAGGVAAQVPLSMWIVLMTLLLSLFLGFAKRRDDVLIYKESGTKARANISNYNTQFIDSVLMFTATLTVVAYVMYCVSSEVIARIGSDKLYLTSFFVIAGVIRYLQLTLVYQVSGNPTKILVADGATKVIVLGWIVLFALLIYV